MLMFVWRGDQGGYGVFFKPAIELIQIICQLLILHSAGGWCLEVGYLFQGKARLVYLYSTFHTQW